MGDLQSSKHLETINRVETEPAGGGSCSTVPRRQGGKRCGEDGEIYLFNTDRRS